MRKFRGFRGFDQWKISGCRNHLLYSRWSLFPVASRSLVNTNAADPHFILQIINGSQVLDDLRDPQAGEDRNSLFLSSLSGTFTSVITTKPHPLPRQIRQTLVGGFSNPNSRGSLASPLLRGSRRGAIFLSFGSPLPTIPPFR